MNKLNQMLAKTASKNVEKSMTAHFVKEPQLPKGLKDKLEAERKE